MQSYLILITSYRFILFSDADIMKQSSPMYNLRRSTRNRAEPQLESGEIDYLSINKKYKRKTKKVSAENTLNEILVQVETRPQKIAETVVTDHVIGETTQVDYAKNIQIANQDINQSNNTSIDQSMGSLNMHQLSFQNAKTGMDPMFVHGPITSVSNTVSNTVHNDNRQNEMLNLAMASYATETLNNVRYGQKYRPSFEASMSHLQFDPNAMEIYSIRDALHSLNDSNVEANQNNYSHIANVSHDMNISNMNRGNVSLPQASQTNIDYYNQNFGAYPFAHSTSLGQTLNDGYYLDALVEERRRRNSTIENYAERQFARLS